MHNFIPVLTWKIRIAIIDILIFFYSTTKSNTKKER